MKVVSSECIILKHQDYRERDRLITFLARDKGRMSGVARGARKITARGIGAYEPLTHGTVYYVESPRSDLVAIRKCDLLPPYPYLQGDYEKFVLGSYLAEWVGLARPAGPDAEPLFMLLLAALEDLYAAEGPGDLALLRLGFELDFLAAVGHQPDWERCAVCERPLFGREQGRPALLLAEPHQLDVALGGLRCPDCRVSATQALPLSPGSLAFLAAWRFAETPAGVLPTRNALAELQAAVTRHLVHQMEREPRSLNLLPPPGAPAGAAGG